MAKLTAFQVGYCTHPSCMVLKGSGLQSRCFPSRAFLIETRAGLCLWDTGYASRFKAAVSTGVYRLYGWVTPVMFDDTQSLPAQLAQLGIQTKDIQKVVLSHFHADHIAGLIDYPHAQLVCCHEGWDTHKKLSGVSALRHGFLPSLIPLDAELRLQFVQQFPRKVLPPELHPFDFGWDLTGTDEVFIVALPGHAKGHLGAFVQTPEGWVLLASDASWTTEGYRELRGPSELSFLVQASRPEYYATLQKIHAVHHRGNVTVELAHVEAPSL